MIGNSMIGALSYLQYHTVKNRLVARFNRLKEPRYLIGAVVGLLYMYFYFFRYVAFRMGGMGGGAAGSGSGGQGLGGDKELFELLWALALFALTLMAWIIPRKRTSLLFTEAEIAFLFPAPISRRNLIHFRLLRTQGSLLLSVLFLTVFFNRFGSAGRGLMHAVSWWVVFSTASLHGLGSSFARTMLMDRGITTWRRRTILFGMLAVLAAAVGVWTARSFPGLSGADLTNLDQLQAYARRALTSGPLPYALFPFRLMARPYFATGWGEFFKALWPALLILVAHYFWVMESDVAFEEASVEASKRQAERITARGARGEREPAKKAKRPPFKLAPEGAAAVGFLWKNLIATGQGTPIRAWAMVVLAVLTAFLVARHSGASWIPLVGMVAGMCGAWAVLMGPQVFRQDFRQDLRLADVLKAYPLRGWQVALGEVLTPSLILSGVQWICILLVVASWTRSPVAGVRPGLILAGGIGAALAMPFLNMVSLFNQNAAVLLFPTWFQLGPESPRGIEATGQRLMFALGQFVALVVALTPAALAFAVTFFVVVKLAASPALAILLGSALTAMVLGVEAWLGVLVLGWLFERLDISSEQTG